MAIVGFNSSISFTGAPGTLGQNEDWNLSNGQPPFVYIENYEAWFIENPVVNPKPQVPNPPKRYPGVSSNPDFDFFSVDQYVTKPTVTTNNGNPTDIGEPLIAPQFQGVDNFDLYGSPTLSFNDMSAFGDIEPGASGQNVDPVNNTNFFGGGFDFGQVVAKPSSATNTISATGNVKSATSQNINSGLGVKADDVSVNPRPNQLTDYASYTYNIALYMMQPKEYVRMLKSPQSVTAIPKQLLMRSGGVGNDGGDNFDIDFFIDNLQMKNVGVSPNTKTTNTNAVEVSFDITEPMGVTLIERLKNEAKNNLEEEQNYLHTPYLLEITFKGYNEQGKQLGAEVKPKYVPIKIIELKFTVESTGTVYRCKAMPYHQDVFSTIRSTIPINIQVSASTVTDIFGGTATEFTQEIKTVTEETQRLGGNSISTQKVTKNKLGESHKTLTDAINKFYEGQTKPTIEKAQEGGPPNQRKQAKTTPASTEVAEKWSFAIAPGIANAKLVGEKFDALNTPAKNSKVYKSIASAIKSGTGGVELDTKTNMFKINAGTNVVSLINYILVASEYIDKNVEATANKLSQDEDSSEHINWFRIVPQIVGFQGWDKKEGRYKFHVKWTVQEMALFYSDFPWAPKTMPKGKGVHKIYDYIFSGNNTEVQKFRMNFDAAYYQAHTIGTGVPTADKNISDVTTQVKSIPQSTQGQGMVNDEGITKKRSKDLMSSLMHDGADLIQCDLDILGDPAFIPVGDAFFQPQGNRNQIYNSAFLPDGTINYDLTPPYIQINLRTPSDYDEFTGLVDLTKQTKYSSSEFSGVYKIIVAQSTFSGGVFTQNLTGIREKMQPQANGKLARSKYSQKSIERGALLVDDFGDPSPGKPSVDYSDFASSGSVTQTVQGSDYIDDSAFVGDKRFSEEITQDYSLLADAFETEVPPDYTVLADAFGTEVNQLTGQEFIETSNLDIEADLNYGE